MMKKNSAQHSPIFSQVQERPFKGRIMGSFENRPTSNPAIYDGVANARGNVTHLGVFDKPMPRDVVTRVHGDRAI